LKTLITNASLVLPEMVLDRGDLLIEDGVIRSNRVHGRYEITDEKSLKVISGLNKNNNFVDPAKFGQKRTLKNLIYPSAAKDFAPLVKDGPLPRSYS
jgi:hypothetical protein